MWRIIRTTLTVAGLAVSVAGCITFATAAVVVWKAKAEVDRRTDALATKANTAVNATGRAVKFVSEVVTQGEKDLKATRANPPPPVTRKPVSPFERLAARRASENLAGSVERANAAIVTASDAVEVAQSALNLFESDEPVEGFKTWLGVKPEQLTQTRTELGTASRELKNVRTILGVPISDGAHPTADELRTVESALQQARSLTDQMERVVDKARDRVNETKRTVDLWVQRIAVGVTVVGVLGALGQFFMARFCWRVLRGKPA